MTAGPPPDLDVARVQRWCRARVPASARTQVAVEWEVSGRDVTILECRAPWHPDAGPEWTSFLKELLRRAALLAATRTPEASDLAVSGTDLGRALDELLDTRNAMTRTLLGSTGGYA